MKIIIDTNQYPIEDLPRAKELKADGIWAVVSNSPGFTPSHTRKLIDSINSKNITVEEGGIDERQLLDDPNWTGKPPNINQGRMLVVNAHRIPKRAMVYTEYYHGAPGNTLDVSDLKRAYKLEGKTPLLPMARNFLPENKAKIAAAFTLPKTVVCGLCFELETNLPLILTQKIVGGIRYVLGKERECWIILSPKAPSYEYEKDVETTLKFFISHINKEMWAKLNFVLAVYEVERKGTSFFGETNSMIAALKVAKKYQIKK